MSSKALPEMCQTFNEQLEPFHYTTLFLLLRYQDSNHDDDTKARKYLTQMGGILASNNKDP